MITTNPTSYIVTVAEHAAAKILALAGSGSPGGSKPSSSAAPPKSSAKQTSTKASNTPVPPKTSSAAPPKSSTKPATPTPTGKPAQAVSPIYLSLLIRYHTDQYDSGTNAEAQATLGQRHVSLATSVKSTTSGSHSASPTKRQA